MTHRRLRVLSLSALCLLGCAVAASAQQRSSQTAVTPGQFVRDAAQDYSRAAEGVVDTAEGILDGIGRTLEDIGREVGITVRPLTDQRRQAARERAAAIQRRNMEFLKTRVEAVNTLDSLRKWQQASLTPEQREQMKRQARRIREARERQRDAQR